MAQKLATRTKLILMAIVPTIALLLFAVSATTEKAAVANEMSKLEALVGVSVKIGDLAHELQKERGLSAGFIGSKGAKNVTELPAQRGETDKKAEVLAAALKTFDPTQYGDGFKAVLSTAATNLQELAAKRTAVTALQIEAPDSAAYYTKTISGYLKAPATISTLSTSGEVARLGAAYSSLLEAKERAGRERALLAMVFTADKFTPGTLGSFLKNAGAQDVYTDEFLHYALDSQKKFFLEKVSGESVDEVAKLKKFAIDNTDQAKLGVDPAQWFKVATNRINLLKEVEARMAGDLLSGQARLRNEASQIMMLFITLTALSVLATSILAYYMSRSIMRQLGGEPDYAADITRNIAAGKLDNVIAVQSGDTGSLVASLRMMQEQLLERITADKKIADVNLRIRIALDNVSTGVMIANTERDIIYVNSSVVRILKEGESEIRKVLPNFNADKLVGVNIDGFHKNPRHQADLLATLNTVYTAKLKVGTRHMVVRASPVINAQNERLGSVAEWQDRTAEVAVEDEVAGIVQGAMMGDFDKRLSLEGKEGFLKTLAEGLNRLSETTSTGLNDVARVLQSVAQGDLTEKIDSDYEGIFGQLKDDTNATVERLREVIGRIKDASEAINVAAKEISAGNTDLSSRTEEQASSLEETASSMEELNSTVKQNADNANQANTLARNSNDIAVKSGQMVQQIVSTMTGISESSKKIADIIGVIDSIAFQTNILALNAAVEAARAGEQGRGFAVVATEVRNLAHRSATAAKEIKELIVESGGKVDAGTKLVDHAGQSMTEVVTSFSQVTALVTDIANSSREQSSGIEQVTQAVAQMDEVTQQNAALVEQSAAAAESLEEQAHGLVQAVAMFKLAEDDGRSNLPAASLRTVQMKKIAAAPKRPGASSRSAPARSSATAVKKLAPPPQGKASDEEWEEF